MYCLPQRLTRCSGPKGRPSRPPRYEPFFLAASADPTALASNDTRANVPHMTLPQNRLPRLWCDTHTHTHTRKELVIGMQTFGVLAVNPHVVWSGMNLQKQL